ncbi:hypothetical protein [Methylobacterium longum]|uniref:Uncharacterized protein n=1 Tax=Methylobacterium longum TaxID=767694 RepID=A0ABT8AYY8_9HYPH|nr:hypothetical protein [Methylobacterium longum]MDN3574636.1 hypothetical protein [Methylobacterium longum]GJE14749.1 hypothetical protein FOHLNKBM_5824 [Methylobacterium longum]
MRAICEPTDLVEPICQGLCSDAVRPELVITPLAGGRQATGPIRPVELGKPTVTIDPKTGLPEDNTAYDIGTNGYPLGTAGVPTGTSQLSGGASAITGGAGR